MWLIVAVLAYFILAIVSLFDRYFLVGPISSPKVYTFYIGTSCLLFCFFLIPFGISLPATGIIFLGLAAGLTRMLGTLFLTISITRSEISRVIPAIGALQPIFSFFLFFLFLPQSRALSPLQAIAFVLLVLGSVLISVKKFDKEFFSLQALRYPIIASLLYSLMFFLIKNLFLKTTFLNGIFLILLGNGLASLVFFALPKDREIIFNQKLSKKISGFFVLGQALGGLALLLQYYAVFLAKPGQVPLINALEGTRYVFLLIFVFLLAGWKPQLLNEEVSRKAFLPKVLAVLLIVGGMALLVL
jgi:drug/metabolite transporter (DMT)-like permease